jgi:hypothetical protein
MKGYEFEAVIEARREVKEMFRKNREALENEVRLNKEERQRNGVLQPLRDKISMR